MIVLNLDAPCALPLRLLPEGDRFILDDSLCVNISDNALTPLCVTIPAGYVTDFASIPPELGILGFEKLGKHTHAALVHDFLYTSQVGYELANTAFYMLLRRSGVSRLRAALMAFATEAGGKSRYKKAAPQTTSSISVTAPTS